MRGTHVFLGALAVLVIGLGIGMLLYALAQPPARSNVWPPIGITGHVRGSPEYPRARVFTEESSLRSWEEAERRLSASDATTHDLVGLMSAEDQSRLVFPDSTAVRVRAVDGTAVQIEVLDGPLTGKRGWDLASHFVPDL